MIITLLDGVLFTVYFLLLFLAIFWLLVLFSPEEKKERKRWRAPPLFTAIVPAYNEEGSIEETLTSLINLDYPIDKKEIIVVNDGSRDRTKEIVESFIAAHPQNSILLINQQNGGKGNALNTGLRIARGEFYACLDADSFVRPDALQEMLPYFENKDVAAVCPLLKVRKPASVLQKVQWCEYVINMFYKFLNARLDCIHVTPGPFSVYRTSVIKELGGYDEKTLTEDLEIAIRLQKHHYRIIQTFDAIVETNAPNTWKELFRQRVRWYKGSIDNSLTYKSLMFNRKYGDFGMMRMPTIILSGILALILITTLMREGVKRSFHWIQSLAAVNFDILTLLKQYSWEINILNLPLFKIFIAITLFSITIFMMVYSYRLVKEKITNYGRTWVSLVTYLFMYGVFISMVWVYIAFLFVTKKKQAWS